MTDPLTIFFWFSLCVCPAICFAVVCVSGWKQFEARPGTQPARFPLRDSNEAIPGLNNGAVCHEMTREQTARVKASRAMRHEFIVPARGEWGL